VSAAPLAESRGMAGYATVLAALLLILSWMPAGARADVASGTGLQPDVRLLIDISASMKQSDPENLRAQALDLIVRLLPDGARAGIWSFAGEVEELAPLGPIDRQWRQSAGEAIATIVNSGERTDIPAALAAAIPDLDRLDPAHRTSVVLLTDGKVDVSDSPVVNASAARRILDRVAPGLGAAGIPVHTVALADEADWQFLRALARTTGGIAEKADDAGELTAIFLQALEMVAPMPRVPLAGNRFHIDGSVKAFTALVFAGDGEKPVVLVDPAGIRIGPDTAGDGVEWFRNAVFTVATVTGPAAGSWGFAAPAGSDARVTVISDPELEIDPLPTRLAAGRQAEVVLRLRKGDETISDPEVLALFPIALEVAGPSGERVIIDVTASYPLPADGEYRIRLPGFDEPGRYRVLARVDAPTMRRELPMYVEVDPTPETSAIVTRGADVEQQDLRLPLLTAGLVLAIVLLVVWWILRRRRRRRLELWQRRGRPVEARAGDGDPLSGAGGEPAQPRH